MSTTKYRDSYPDLVAFMARRGFTLQEIAAELQVSLTTLKRWRSRYPDFESAFQTGKRIADAQVEGCLFRRATGYSYVTQRMTRSGDVVTVRVTEPPDITAMIFWLKNRLSAEWRDRKEVEHGGTVNILEARRKLTDLLAETIDEAENITADAS